MKQIELSMAMNNKGHPPSDQGRNKTHASWYYPDMNGAEAETRLLKKGRDGCFLVRPSGRVPGNSTITYRQNDDVDHINVQNTGDYYDLYGGDRFDNLEELVRYYMAHPSQLRYKNNGVMIHLRYPLSWVDYKWFHPELSGRGAELLLQNTSVKEGNYLVRNSNSHPGDYVLSFRVMGEIGHIMIRCQDGKYDVGGGEPFEMLPDLIEHYRRSPMVNTNGIVVHLKQPLLRTPEQNTSSSTQGEESNYERMCHVPQTDQMDDDYTEIVQQPKSSPVMRHHGLPDQGPYVQLKPKPKPRTSLKPTPGGSEGSYAKLVLPTQFAEIDEEDDYEDVESVPQLYPAGHR